MVAMIMSLMVKDPNMDEEGWHKVTRGKMTNCCSEEE